LIQFEWGACDLSAPDQDAENSVDLKGRGFSRAARLFCARPALAAEGMQTTTKGDPSGAKAHRLFFAVIRHG
jgi:hypothetical protein